MRCPTMLIAILVVLAALGACSKNDTPDKPRVESPALPADVNIDIPPGMGAIRIATGPFSPEVVTEAFYHMRRQFPLQTFELGIHRYALMDSIDRYDVIGYAKFNDFTYVVDSVEPGLYNLLVYVSRLSRAEALPDTVIGPSGDTTITDPTDGMIPYDFYFRPIFVDSLVVSAGQVASVDLSQALEKWERPRQLETGWEAPRARYLRWSGNRQSTP